MTIVVVRDGVMACDTLVTGHNYRIGKVRKWVAVHPDIGGGFAGFAGELSEAINAMECMADRRRDGFGVAVGVWLRGDGVVLEKYGEGNWYTYEAPFAAIGSGDMIALGALATGATAEEAAKVAMEYSLDCGGDVEVVSINS